MIGVNDTYLACLRLITQDKSGYISTAEFNQASKRAEILLWRFYAKHFEEHGIIADAMYPFNEKVVQSLDANAQFSLPTDFGRRINVWYRKLTTVAGSEPTIDDRPARFLEGSEVQETLRSGVRKPSLANDTIAYSFTDGKVQMWPSTLTGAALFEYLRLPTYAVRGFTLDATNDEEDYDSASSTDYEWPDQEQENIIDLILFQFGLYLRSSEILNWAQTQIADSRNQSKL